MDTRFGKFSEGEIGFASVRAALNRNKRLIALATLGAAAAALISCAWKNRATLRSRASFMRLKKLPHATAERSTARFNCSPRAIWRARPCRRSICKATRNLIAIPACWRRWLGSASCPIRRSKRRTTGRSPISSIISRSRRRPGRTSCRSRFPRATRILPREGPIVSPIFTSICKGRAGASAHVWPCRIWNRPSWRWRRESPTRTPGRKIFARKRGYWGRARTLRARATSPPETPRRSSPA